MGDRVLYKTESLTAAYEELGALVRALEDVADGLDRVNTSAQWWGRVSVRVSGTASDARSAVRTLRSQVKRTVDTVSDIRSGVVKTRAAFDAADSKIVCLADGVSQGSGNEWGRSGLSGGGGGGGAWGSASGGGFRGSGGGGGGGGGGAWGNLLDGALGVFFGFIPGIFPKPLDCEVADDRSGITAWHDRATIITKNGTDRTEINAYTGKIEFESDWDEFFADIESKREYRDGKWKDPEDNAKTFGIKAALGYSMSLFAMDYHSTTGDDILGTEAKLEGSLGNARLKGKGELSMGEHGINAYVGGEAIVSAAEGKASGTINIFGFEITAEATGYAGTLGAKGKFGFEDGDFVMEGGAAAGIGGAVGLKIGLNDTGQQFVENMADGFQDFAEGVEVVAETLGDWFASAF